MEPRRKFPARSQDLGQQVEDRRRVAFLAGRFAGGEADLALGHGEAGNGIHDQKHVGALVAEVLGDGQGDEAGADAQGRRALAGGADHDGTFAAFGAEFVFEEAADFAIAFADHGDHGDVGRVVARHGAEQGALADAAAAEDADALALCRRAAGRRWRGCR